MSERSIEILDLLGPTEIVALYRGYHSRCLEIEAMRAKSMRNLNERGATLDHYDLANGHLMLLRQDLLELAERNPRKALFIAEDLALSPDENLQHMAAQLREAAGE